MFWNFLRGNSRLRGFTNSSTETSGETVSQSQEITIVKIEVQNLAGLCKTDL
jgi:hypothetical protein